MCLLVELLLITSFIVSAEGDTIVSGNVGENVILPCSVKYRENFSYNTLNIRWKTEQKYVKHFYYGKFQDDLQNKIFKGRTHLFYYEFPKGNLSLALNNIQTSDAGIYECLVFISKDKYTTKTELVVQDQVYTYGFPNESSISRLSIGILSLCGAAALIVFLRRRKKSRGTMGMACGKKSPNTIRDGKRKEE
ncbi:V-set domain-containing T-cell activation inhibitor 1-like [Ranitomeya imitator]|uniref:V-set domain-containing T-cell activation inhibitor 1-like n=1 Tax=Ranitomeya imitator TaxID=111125 RepID=UPI0037E91B02